MKVSIITATFNNHSTLEECLKSIHSQSYRDIEHIVVDGGSTDGTLDILRKHEDRISILVSEPDKGIYYALNKGIALATGDIIGFLHADDFFANDTVVERVVLEMVKDHADSCYGDLEYVSRKDTEKVIRYWRSCPYEDGLFMKGWMPPHPTLFIKKHIYEEYGYFNTDFKIAADYELILRFFAENKVSTRYIPEVLVKMRTGGASNRSLKNIIFKTIEDYRACKINGLSCPFRVVLLKNLSKTPQFFER